MDHPRNNSEKKVMRLTLKPKTALWKTMLEGQARINMKVTLSMMVVVKRST